MKLSRYTDYALRVMIFLAGRQEGLASIRQIAEGYGISQNHLMKIVQDLGRAGFVETVRGRGGGLRLARPPQQINLGALVRQTERQEGLVDCSTCRVAGTCGLPAILSEAHEAFLHVLDRYTLADICGAPGLVAALFDLPAA